MNADIDFLQNLAIIGLGIAVLLIGASSIIQSRTIRRLSGCIETIFDTIKKIAKAVLG